MPKTERMLKIMQRVYEKRSFTVGEMADEFSVSYRTMLRYLHELSDLGVPLYATEGKHGGYSVLTSRQLRELATAAPDTEAVKRVVKPRIQIVGLEMKTPFTAFYMTHTLKPKLWQELVSRLHEIPYRRTTPRPSYVAAVMNRQQIYHYVAGIEVTALGSVPEGMVSLTIPAQEYAMYTHEGRSDREDIDQSYAYVLQRMKQLGMNPDPGCYALECRDDADASVIQMFIPIKK